MITDADLDQLKKLLDISREYGVQCVSVGPVSVTLGPTPKSTYTASTIDDKEERLNNLKEELLRHNDDVDADLFWST